MTVETKKETLLEADTGIDSQGRTQVTSSLEE